jgi:pilus assembly protein CpaB
LPEGHLVTAADVRLTMLPAGSIPNGFISSIDAVAGRVTRMPVVAGEAVVQGRLAPTGAGAGLEVKIMPGMRAKAVRIDDVSGLSGLIQPNSRVDVLLVIRDAAAQERAKLFLNNIRVLSVGSQIDRTPSGRGAANATNATYATLEVTPAQAEQLAIASSAGRIELALRGYGDPETVETRGATTRDMLTHTSDLSVDETPRPIMTPARPGRPAAAPKSRETVPLAVAPLVNEAKSAPMPRRSDSTVVQVYRGSAVTHQAFVKKDTNRITP